MTTLTWGRVAAAGILTLGIAAGVGAHGSPGRSGQAPVEDHWRLVPPLPTSCFAGDDFNDKLDAASTALGAEVEKQQKINEVARERFDNMDMAEKAQKMQAFMMKNPQEAMKMMQAEQAAGTAGTEAIAAANASATRLDAELERLKASFRTAAADAVKPIVARQKQLIDAKTKPFGEAAIPMFTSAADHAQYLQLIAEENAVYERACAPFFGANGSFHKWASSYRTEVVDKLAVDGAGDGVMIMQMKALDLPGGGYRSTTPLQQANNFTRRIREAWGVRLNKTTPRVELKK